MIELRWIGRVLQYRQRGFQQDASGSFCGITEFGDWETIPDVVGTSGRYDAEMFHRSVTCILCCCDEVDTAESKVIHDALLECAMEVEHDFMLTPPTESAQ